MEKIAFSKGKALSVAPRHLSQRERQVESCETKAFLPEEGGAAQAATEGAEQVCIRHKRTQKETPQTRSLFVLPRTIFADVNPSLSRVPAGRR